MVYPGSIFSAALSNLLNNSTVQKSIDRKCQSWDSTKSDTTGKPCKVDFSLDKQCGLEISIFNKQY